LAGKYQWRKFPVVITGKYRPGKFSKFQLKWEITMVAIIFMQSDMEIALPVKKLSSKNWSNLSGV
jgi:hypothetical protein